MFTYTAHNAEGEALVHMPIDTMEGKVFKTGEIADISLMFKGIYLGQIENIQQRFLSEGDYLRITLDFGAHNMLSRMGETLRWRDLSVSDLFNMIFQIGVSVGGEKTRKPIHNFRPQTLSAKPTVPDEKQQSLRWWYPRRLVQWFTT